MTKDTPGYDESAKERGLYARHGDDPTLGSYLSSILYLVSVPMFIVLAYAGYWLDFWGYGNILIVFAVLLIGAIAGAFLVMHIMTGR